MINLAGNKMCDKTIIEELQAAGIGVVAKDLTSNEVPAHHGGQLNGFEFQRGWYYWRVSGLMPISVAEIMYNQSKELNIRVAGHCGNPPPDKWVRKIGTGYYIESYHIDTQEGLNFFTETVKKYNVSGESNLISIEEYTEELKNRVTIRNQHKEGSIWNMLNQDCLKAKELCVLLGGSESELDLILEDKELKLFEI